MSTPENICRCGAAWVYVDDAAKPSPIAREDFVAQVRAGRTAWPTYCARCNRVGMHILTTDEQEIAKRHAAVVDGMRASDRYWQAAAMRVRQLRARKNKAEAKGQVELHVSLGDMELLLALTETAIAAVHRCSECGAPATHRAGDVPRCEDC